MGRALLGNPVILTTEVAAILTTVSAVAALATGAPASFAVQLALWLWATVLLANVAEAFAEGHGRAQADALRATRLSTQAKVVDPPTGRVSLRAAEPVVGTVVLVEAGGVIPAGGEIAEGVASVNEAAITGESAPVIRESGGRPLGRHGGHHGRLRLDQGARRVRAGSTFLDRMFAMARAPTAARRPTRPPSRSSWLGSRRSSSSPS